MFMLGESIGETLTYSKLSKLREKVVTRKPSALHTYLAWKYNLIYRVGTEYICYLYAHPKTAKNMFNYRTDYSIYFSRKYHGNCDRFLCRAEPTYQYLCFRPWSVCRGLLRTLDSTCNLKKKIVFSNKSTYKVCNLFSRLQTLYVRLIIGPSQKCIPGESQLQFPRIQSFLFVKDKHFFC